MEFNKDVFTDKDDKWSFIISLIVIAFFAILAYFLLSKINTKTESSSLPSPEENNNEIVSILKEEKTTITKSKKIKHHKSKIEAEGALNDYTDSAIVITDFGNTKSEIITPIITEETVEVIPETSSPIKKEPSSPTTPEELNTTDSVSSMKETIAEITESSEDTITETITDEVIKEEIVVASKLDEKEEEEITEQKIIPDPETVKEVSTNDSFDCVIVIGAFTEKSNEEGLKEKLISLGYNHAEGSLKSGLHYVGVPIACNNQQEKVKLTNELNKEFEIQSWVKKK